MIPSHYNSHQICFPSKCSPAEGVNRSHSRLTMVRFAKECCQLFHVNLQCAHLNWSFKVSIAAKDSKASAGGVSSLSTSFVSSSFTFSPPPSSSICFSSASSSSFVSFSSGTESLGSFGCSWAVLGLYGKESQRKSCEKTKNKKFSYRILTKWNIFQDISSRSISFI